MTPRQGELLDWLRAWFARTDVSPSYAEIQAGLGLRSRSAVNRLVTGLKLEGRIVSRPATARSIRLAVVPDAVYQAAERLLDSVTDEDLELGLASVRIEALGDLDLALAEAHEQAGRAR